MKATITDYATGRNILLENLPENPAEAAEIAEDEAGNNGTYMLLDGSPLPPLPREIRRWNPEKGEVERERTIGSFSDALDWLGREAFRETRAKLESLPGGTFRFRSDAPTIHIDGGNGFTYEFTPSRATAHNGTVTFFSTSLDEGAIRAILEGKRTGRFDEAYTWGGESVAEWEDLMTAFDIIICSKK